MYEFKQTDPQVISKWSPQFLNFLMAGLEQKYKDEKRALRKARLKRRR